MKTKMKKYGDGGTKATTRGIQPNPIDEANRLTAYPTTKVSKARAKMKTGGMVNSNTKVQADKTPGSKGVKSGVNKKVSKQTSPKGRVGGTNKSVPKPSKG
jgi:hypothetical protein